MANDQGDMSTNQGRLSGTGFTLFGPNGSPVADGGRNAAVFSAANAYLP